MLDRGSHPGLRLTRYVLDAQRTALVASNESRLRRRHQPSPAGRGLGLALLLPCGLQADACLLLAACSGDHACLVTEWNARDPFTRELVPNFGLRVGGFSTFLD